MLLHDDTVAGLVDRYMLERFVTAAEVSVKKLRLYEEMAQHPEVVRHLKAMAEANDQAKKQLEGMLNDLQ